MDGDERVVAEVNVIPVAVAVDAVRPIPVGLGAATPGSRADERSEQHHRGAQVVLDRVSEEDRSEEQAGECKSIGDPVRTASDLGLNDEVGEAVDDGDERDDAHHEGEDEHGVEEEAPEKRGEA